MSVLARVFALSGVLCLLALGVSVTGADAAVTWSAPKLVDDNDTTGSLVGVACPTSTQCTALDSDGNEMTFNPVSPGFPAVISIDSAGVDTGIACPSASQCTAVDGYGNEVTFDPSAAGDANMVEIDPNSVGDRSLEALTCPSTSQCTAIDHAGNEVTFDPQSPGTPTSLLVDGGARAIACPTTTQCTAADQNGNEVTFDPQSAGTPPITSVSNSVWFSAIACPSAAQCTAVGVEGRESTFDPASPGGVVQSDIEDGVVDVAALTCISTSQCVAVDDNSNGQVIDFNPASPGKAVQTPVETDSSMDSVACPSTTECVGVGNKGLEVTFDPASPTGAKPIDIDARNTLLSIACSTGSLCVAGDGLGQQVDFDPASLGAATLHQLSDQIGPVTGLACPLAAECVGVWWTDYFGGYEATGTFNPQSGSTLSGLGLFGYPSESSQNVAIFPLGVACPSSSQCTAVDTDGMEYTYDPASEELLTSGVVDPAPLFGVACPSTVQCTAVDENGGEVTFDPTAAGSTSTVSIDAGNALNGVACAWVVECVAVDDSGQEITFDPTSPAGATAASVDDGNELLGVACPSLIRCTAVGDSGSQVTFDPTAPAGASVQDVDTDNLLTAVACVSASLCVAADGEGDVLAASGPPVPSNTSPPSIDGTAAQNETLTVSPGTWAGSPTSFRYQWERCAGACTSIPGGTGASYTPTASDVGAALAVVVTAVSSNGPSGPAAATPTARIAAAPKPNPASGGSGAPAPAKATPVANAPPPSVVSSAAFGTPTSGTVGSGAPLTVTASGTPGLSGSVLVPAGALPAGTVVSMYPVTNSAALAAGVPAGQSYVLSFAVSWQSTGGGSPTASTPLTMTITDPSITAGETIYALTSSGLTVIGVATQNGTATVTFTNDPVFVVASLTAATVSLKNHHGVTIVGYDASAKTGAKVKVELIRAHKVIRKASVAVAATRQFSWSTGQLMSGTDTVEFLIGKKVVKTTTITVAGDPKKKHR